MRRNEKGELEKLPPPPIVHMEIGAPGLPEHIVIDDPNGIQIDRDPETGMLNFHAQTMTVASETRNKPRPTVLERLRTFFKRKEG